VNWAEIARALAHGLAAVHLPTREGGGATPISIAADADFDGYLERGMAAIVRVGSAERRFRRADKRLPRPSGRTTYLIAR